MWSAPSLLLSACSGPAGDGKDPGPPDGGAHSASSAHSAGASAATGHSAAPPPTVDDLLAALGDQGVQADEGAISFEAIEDCCRWQNCLLSNEGSEYGTWALPPAPGEYVADRVPDDEGRVLAWRVGDDQGALYVGPPPPGARYVSFRGYVHDRDDGAGGRALVLENLGDSLNQDVWSQADDGTLVVLTTPHAGLAARVAAAAATLGWPVNVDALPGDLANPGLDAPDDTFHVTLRVVGFDDRAAFEAWRDGRAARVFKLRPVTPLPPEPLPVAPVRPAVPQPPPALTDEVAALRQAIVDAHPGWSVVDAELIPREPPLEPAPTEAPCWSGCNRDVAYFSTHATQLLDSDRIVVYGVDPAPLGRATWTEIMLAGERESDAAGHAGTDDLRGTAADWVPGARPELHAFVWARDCTGLPHCQEVPTTCPGLAEDELGTVLWRAYLDPFTSTWPPVSGLGERGALHLRRP